MNRATIGVTVHAQALSRATGIGDAHGCCTRSEDPALLTELARKPSSAPAPLAESLRDLNASLLLFPCPASPDPLRRTHRTNAWCRLVRRVTPMNRGSVVSSIRLRKPGRSTSSCLPQAPHSIFPAAANPGLPDAAKRRVAGRPGSESCGLRPLHHAAERRILLHARAREEKTGVRAQHGLLLHLPCPPPARKTPAESQVCSPRSSGSALRIPPPLAARCRHVSQADRSATPYGCCNPDTLSAVSACRRFSRTRSPPAALVQTPSAFQVVCVSRKTTSDALPRDRPRCCFCSSSGIRYAGYPDRFSSHHSAGEAPILPHHPRSGLLPESRRRDLSAEDLCAKKQSGPVPLRRGTPQGMLPHVDPRE